MKYLLAALLCVPLFGQSGTTSEWHTSVGNKPSAIVIPSTAATTLVDSSVTAPVAGFVTIDVINVYNNSGSAVNVQFFDKSTNCSGSPCPVTPVYAIPANTKYYLKEAGQAAVGGLSVTVGTANAVYVYARGRYY